MSQGSRQEAMIRSCIEATGLILKDKLVSEAGQEAKVEAATAILGTTEQLWRRFPIKLPQKEAQKVIKVLDWFRDTHEAKLHAPEVLIALIMGLADKLERALKPKSGPQASRFLARALDGKYGVVVFLLQQIQLLYDTFDHQGKKTDLIVRGGELCDLLLAHEI